LPAAKPQSKRTNRTMAPQIDFSRAQDTEDNKDNSETSASSAARSVNAHARFAGRFPAGTTQPIALAKNGPRHVRLDPNTSTQSEILSVGLACSECFSGPRLAKLLRPGFEYEMRAMEQLALGGYAPPLSIHTSGGVPEALNDFVEALEPHLPWRESPEDLDWCLSLQIEGASAVWAAVDMLLQVDIIETGDRHRKMVAVGAQSYHGPPATSFGARSPLWNKAYQVKYPVPTAGSPVDEELLLREFDAFLNKHGADVGVLLVEPQWGSSQAALPWPENLLKEYVRRAKLRGIRILCDEIMCGLGRHGKGTLFLSDAWDLDPDAVTFGKSVAGGVYPLSGAVIKTGRSVLGANGRSVMQSHTFAGSSVRALMTGTEVLRELPRWFESISKLGEEMGHIFRHLEVVSRGMVTAQGHGLMWGCLFSREGMHANNDVRAESVAAFKRHCEDVGVLPYFVPAGGCMVTPVIDVDVGTLYEMGQRLEEALKKTVEERGWKSCMDSVEAPVVERAADVLVCADADITKDTDPARADVVSPSVAVCSTQLHLARSCTSCADFVCRDVRRRFLHF